MIPPSVTASDENNVKTEPVVVELSGVESKKLVLPTPKVPIIPNFPPKVTSRFSTHTVSDPDLAASFEEHADKMISERVGSFKPPKPAKRQRAELAFTSYAYMKLVTLRDLGPTEVGGFGITDPDNPLGDHVLLIRDLYIPKQRCSAVTVQFDDDGLQDMTEELTDLGYQMRDFFRVWIHTHPGDDPNPSGQDEETFEEVFGDCDWAVMYILARGGDEYARIRFNAGPGAQGKLEPYVSFESRQVLSLKELEKEYYEKVTQYSAYQVSHYPAHSHRSTNSHHHHGGGGSSGKATGGEATTVGHRKVGSLSTSDPYRYRDARPGDYWFPSYEFNNYIEQELPKKLGHRSRVGFTSPGPGTRTISTPTHSSVPGFMKTAEDLIEERANRRIEADLGRSSDLFETELYELAGDETLGIGLADLTDEDIEEFDDYSAVIDKIKAEHFPDPVEVSTTQGEDCLVSDICWKHVQVYDIGLFDFGALIEMDDVLSRIPWEDTANVVMALGDSFPWSKLSWDHLKRIDFNNMPPELNDLLTESQKAALANEACRQQVEADEELVYESSRDQVDFLSARFKSHRVFPGDWQQVCDDLVLAGLSSSDLAQLTETLPQLSRHYILKTFPLLLRSLVDRRALIRDSNTGALRPIVKFIYKVFEMNDIVKEMVEEACEPVDIFRTIDRNCIALLSAFNVSSCWIGDGTLVLEDDELEDVAADEETVILAQPKDGEEE